LTHVWPLEHDPQLASIPQLLTKVPHLPWQVCGTHTHWPFPLHVFGGEQLPQLIVVQQLLTTEPQARPWHARAFCGSHAVHVEVLVPGWQVPPEHA
jgi:hypothetical protein